MSLHVIIGFDARGASGKPSLVYVGRSAQKAKDAKALDTSSVCFEEFHNVMGLRKNNPIFQPVEAEAAVAAEVKTPEVETPEVETPEVETPEVETPEVETPETETPEVEDSKVRKKQK